MGVFLQKWAFFLKEKVFALYARPLDADPLAYYWCVAPGPWCRRNKKRRRIFNSKKWRHRAEG